MYVSNLVDEEAHHLGRNVVNNGFALALNLRSPFLGLGFVCYSARRHLGSVFFIVFFCLFDDSCSSFHNYLL